MCYESKDSDQFSWQRWQVCNEIFMLWLISWCGDVLLEFLLFFSPGIRNYWRLFTVSVFGCIRNYLLIVTVYRHCSSRHYLCTDSIIVQTLFMQRFLQKNLELLLTITVRHCSLLCKTHYCAKQFAFSIHCIIMNVLFIIWFFHFHMPIYI